MGASPASTTLNPRHAAKLSQRGLPARTTTVTRRRARRTRRLLVLNARSVRKQVKANASPRCEQAFLHFCNRPSFYFSNDSNRLGFFLLNGQLTGQDFTYLFVFTLV